MDDQFDALRNVHRRRLLVALLDRETVEGAEWRRGAAVTVGGTDPGTNDGTRAGARGPPDSTAAELYHVHLPRLDDQGFVDYDRESDVVTRGERYDEIRPMLELLDANAERLTRWP